MKKKHLKEYKTFHHLDPISNASILHCWHLGLHSVNVLSSASASVILAQNERQI